MKWHRPYRVLVIMFITAQALASAPYEVTEKRAPCKEYTPLKIPLFGDTHVHTRYSLDASTQDTRTTPDQAYKFARGERLDLQPWDELDKPLRSLKLSRPLDFCRYYRSCRIIWRSNNM